MNVQRVLLSLAGAIALIACGGATVTELFEAGTDGAGGNGPGNDSGATQDGPTRGDGSSAPDTAPVNVCGPHTGSGGGSSSGCEVTDQVTCGDTTYRVTCRCPAAECQCALTTSTGGSGGSVAFDGCPSCNSADVRKAYKECGFP